MIVMFARSPTTIKTVKGKNCCTILNSLMFHSYNNVKTPNKINNGIKIVKYIGDFYEKH